MPRKYTNKLIERAEYDCISWETIARECLMRMSEGQVADMCNDCDWICEDEWITGPEGEED